MLSQEHPLLIEKNGYFRTTDRPFEEVLDFIDLTPDKVMEIPKGATIVEVGSGLTQSFSRGIQELRPDLHPISIDPSLMVTEPEATVTNSKRDETGKLVQVAYSSRKDYVRKPDDLKLYDPEGTLKAIAEERFREARKTGNTLAALTPNLPFANESVDLLVETFGSFIYDRSFQQAYLKDIERVLKEGGQATIYPLDDMLDAMKFLNNPPEEVNEHVKARITETLKAFPGYTYEFYTKNDPGKDNAPRIGMKLIKKKQLPN